MSRETDFQKIEPRSANTAQVAMPVTSIELLLKEKGRFEHGDRV